MLDGKFRLKMFIVVFVVLVGFLFVVNDGIAIEKEFEASSAMKDLIIIDTIRVNGDLERSPVMFFHGKHVDVLSEYNYDCTTCHETNEKKLSIKFKRFTDKDNTREDIMKIYHVNCIDCHTNSDKHKMYGPITCGGCHKNELGQEGNTAQNKVKFSKSLHYRHIKSNDNKCDNCHHEYDDKSKQLVYKKGNESPCSHCHLDYAVDKVISFREASHDFCIGCHREFSLKKKKGGPIKCFGCHNLEDQVMDGVPENIPRLDRGQPNSVFIKNVSDNLGVQIESSSMNLVLFDHKTHEDSNETCITCHHASFEPCMKCHSIANANISDAKEDAKKIDFFNAMHGADKQRSCVGCHKYNQRKSECFGCHDLLNRQDDNFSDFACNSCHKVDKSKLEMLVKTDKYEECGRAFDIKNEMWMDCSSTAEVYKYDDIPDKVSIDCLENKYMPVIFPHRKIVFSLLDGIKNNKLASRFHRDDKVVCLGCHHNAPVSKKPPACVNCHGDKTVNIATISKPPLVNAYHRQCINCHSAMNLDKPDSRNCNVCHKDKGGLK